MALQVCDTIQRKEDLIDGIVKHSLAFEMSWYFKPWERFNQAIFGTMRLKTLAMAQGVEDIRLLY